MDNFDFGGFDFNEFLKQQTPKNEDGLRPDFVRTGTRGLDEAIARVMDLNDLIQANRSKV